MDGELLERAWRRASAAPEVPLFSFVNEGGTGAQSLTLAQTFAAAEGVAAVLRERYGVVAGERVLLVHQPCLAFVPALIGCMLIGAVPVPVYPPDPLAADSAAGLSHVVADAGARLALTTAGYNRARMLGAVRRRLSSLRWPDLIWVSTDKLPARRPAPSAWVHAPGDATLLLQYTSGSTSEPRGVEITHANIEHQLAFNRDALDGAANSHAVMWVPQYHDFGLISGILSALYGNWRLTFLSPLAFLKRPRLWFDIIDRVRATHTAAPDFGYSLAARKIPADVVKAWDLSCLRVAMTAAEPIREATISTFCAHFSSARFLPTAFCHAYGLAEHTVGVTVGGRGFVRVSPGPLARGRVVIQDGEDTGATALARCGRPRSGIDVRIVDAATDRPCRMNEVGEVWVSSASVAAGYFRRPEETERTFRARLPGDARSWLRTGDLGFLHDGELILCGRAKDVVIVHGRNLYPQDIEATAQGAAPAVRPGNVIAFSAEQDGREALFIVAEVREGGASPAAHRCTAEAIAAAVSGSHGAAPAEVVLLGPGGLPKTTSGKVQRARCRTLWRDGALPALMRWSPPQTQQAPAATSTAAARDGLGRVLAALPAATEDTRLDQLVEALRAVLAERTGWPLEAIQSDVPMQAQGADSIVVAEVARTIEEVMRANIPLNVLVSHASLIGLSSWLLSDVLKLPFVASAAPQRGAPLRAFGGRRRDPSSTRVAIVGGGVAGLVAADTLRSLGYRHVTVYEADAEVGGKVRTVHHDGRPYELGQVGFVDSYAQTLAYLRASGLSTRVAQGRPWAARAGRPVPIDLAEAAAWAERLLALAQRDDAPLPSRPIAEWLAQSEAGALPPAYKLYWTGFGYGHEDVPAAYLLEYLRLLPRITIAVQAEQGNQRVWTALCQRLADGGVRILRSCPIEWVTTPPHEPASLAHSDGRIDEADEVIFACPPWHVARLLESPEERGLFSRFRAIDYRVTLIEAEGLLDRAGSLVLLDAIGSQDEVGAIISCSRPYEDTNVAVVYQYAAPADSDTFGVLSNAQLDERLTADLTRRGARLLRIIERARWRYFPHLSPADHAAGTLGRIEALQGLDGRWFVGSYLNLETVEAVARHAAELIAQGFGRAQPHTALDRLDDAMARDAATPAPPFPSQGAPVSLAQRTLLLARRRVPRLDTAGAVVHIRGALDRSAFARALQRQLDRLEGLRLRIWDDGAAAVARLHDASPLLEEGWSQADAREPFATWLARFHGRRVDDPRQAGAAFALCSLGPDHLAVAFAIDHLSWDAIGQTWMMRLLADACSGHVPADAPVLPTRHLDVLARERDYVDSAAHDIDRVYWQERLAQLFPNDEPTTLTGSSDARSQTVRLSPMMRSTLRCWSDTHGASTALFVLAGLLCRWTRSGRAEGLVLIDIRTTSRPGLFDGGIEPQQRTVPIGLRLAPHRPVVDLLHEVRTTLAEATRHAALGSEALAELLHASAQSPRFLWDVNVFPQLLSVRAADVRLRMEQTPATHHEHRASFRVIEDIGSGAISIVLLHRLTELSSSEGESVLAEYARLLQGLATAAPTDTIAALFGGT